MASTASIVVSEEDRQEWRDHFHEVRIQTNELTTIKTRPLGNLTFTILSKITFFDVILK